MREFPFSESLDVLGGQRAIGVAQDHPCQEFFAVRGIGHTHHLNIANCGVRVEELFDLTRVNVFATANDHVLNAAGDIQVAVLVHDRQVARMHPPSVVDRFSSLVWFVPVPAHHRVPARTQLTFLSTRQRQPGDRVSHLHLHVRHDAANGLRATLNRIVCTRHGGHRGSFGHSVTDCHLGHIHPINDLVHDLHWARGAGHHARAQGAEVVLAKVF